MNAWQIWSEKFTWAFRICIQKIRRNHSVILPVTLSKCYHYFWQPQQFIKESASEYEVPLRYMRGYIFNSKDTQDYNSWLTGEISHHARWQLYLDNSDKIVSLHSRREPVNREPVNHQFIQKSCILFNTS